MKSLIHPGLVALVFAIAFLSLSASPLWATDHSGTIYNDTIWYAADNPHVIVGIVTVPDTVTLTLEDGVEVQLNSGRYISVQGALTAVGTPGTGILFTRSGTSNGHGLLFRSGGKGTFDYCTIEYLTYGIYTYSGADTISVSNCTIQNNNNGIYALGGTVELSSDTLANNTTYGFYGDEVAPTLLDVNNVFENNPTGIYLRDIPGLNFSTAVTVRNNTNAGVHLYNCTANATLDNLTLQGNGGTYGAIYIQTCGEFTIGSGNTNGGLGQENSWPVSMNIASYPSLASSGNIPTSGNTNNGIQVRGGSTAASITWRFLGVDYIVTSNPTISAGRTLDIEDGVTVKFDNGRKISVYGTLNAPGSAGILFTRYQGGDQWSGLYFYSGSSGTLQHCTIEYATYSTGYGIYANGVFPTIENCTIRNSDYGIYCRSATSPALFTANTIQDNGIAGVCFYQCTSPSISNQTITGNSGTYGAIYMQDIGEFTIGSGNTIGGVGLENSWPLTITIGSYPSAASSGNIPTSGNTNDDIQVYGGSSANTGTWRKFTGLDYIVVDSPTISAGGVLDIEDGVEVQFNSGRFISIQGTLTALGTPGTGILFTRSGASNGSGLHFRSGSKGTLDYCTIEYASYGIYIYSGADTISVSNCTVQNNTNGIYALGGTVELSSDTLTNNSSYGFYGNEVAPTLLDVNNVFENNLTGIYLRDIPGLNFSIAATVRNNTNAGVHLRDCTGNATLDNLTLQGNGGTYGAIRMQTCGEFTIGSGNTIGGLGQENSWPLTITMDSYPSAASSGNIPTSGNTNNGIQVYGGSTADSVTWPDVGIDYVVTSNPTISAGGTLDIEDGVTVRFDHGHSLHVYGTLNATGNAGILFTRYQGGDQWYGLWFYAGSGGTLQYCTIEYATYSTGYGIYANGVFPTIENCTIRNNDYGIYCRSATSPALDTANTIQDNSITGIHFSNCTNPSVSNQTITGHSTTYGAIYMQDTGEFTIGVGNTIGGGGLENSWPLTISMGSYPSTASSGNIPTSGNTNDDIQVYGGSSANTGTWRKFTGLDYIVTSSPTISAGGVLDIEDGVEVQFNSGRFISIQGTLTALGTPGTGILFTRSGASNGSGLHFRSGSKGTLDYCTIEYASYGIYIYSGADTISLSNCTMQNNDYGIRAVGGTVELSSDTLANNTTYGFYGDEVAPTFLDVNNVFENNPTGIYLRDISGLSLTTAATVRNNTNAGVRLYNCTGNATLDNLTLQGNGGTYGAIRVQTCGEFTIGSGNTIGGLGLENSWPLTIEIGSYPSAASSGNIPTSGNTNNGIQVYGGSTADSVTWSDVGVDYIVTSSSTISAGGTLEIEDGVEVQLNSGRYIDIYGTLTAVGTPGTGILFTRSGTSNGSGLHFQSGGRGTFDHCTIEYASYGFYIYSGADTISLSNCTIQNNNYGVRASAGTLIFINNQIINNTDYGIYLDGAIPASFGSNLSEWNDIYNNGAGSDGRDLRNGTIDTYAPYVYWGTVNSPEIETKIWDIKDDIALGAVCYAPWSNAAHDQTTALWLNIDLESGTKSTSGNMQLDWTEYCGQEGVDHYVIYRSTVAGTQGDSLAGTTDNTYLDVGAAGDADANYFYTVEVVDGVGSRFDSNQVGEFDRELINGL